jgi:uncharacterized protein (TIGR02757 family)
MVTASTGKAGIFKNILDKLYLKYNRKKYVYPDPLSFLYHYSDPGDREIAGFLASSLAFGNVKQIIGSVDRLLNSMGKSPRRFVLTATHRELKKALSEFKHRWITGEEVGGLLLAIRKVLKSYGTLECCFQSKIKEEDKDIIPVLTRFVNELNWNCARKGFLPCPSRGSACKRLNLFLRWMVRCDEVDPGGWQCVPPSMLIVPLDTHMYRLSRKMGFTQRSQKDMKTARDITQSFLQLSPEDPVKYDFALTRLGIISNREMEQFEKSLEKMNC